MEILGTVLSATAGALVGAVVTSFITETRRSRGDRKKAVVTLATEISLNLDAVIQVLKTNAVLVKKWELIKGQSKISIMHDWWEIVPFTDSGWSAVANSGLLSKIDTEIIKFLSRSYTFSRRADYAAGKLQFGKFGPEEAAQYTKRAYTAGDALWSSLLFLRKHPKYAKFVIEETGSDDLCSLWERESPNWLKMIHSAEDTTAK